MNHFSSYLFLALDDGSFILPNYGSAIWRLKPGEPVQRVTKDFDWDGDLLRRCNRDSGQSAEIDTGWLSGVAGAPGGTIYVSDALCGQVLALKPDGTYTRFAGVKVAPADEWPRDGGKAVDAFLNQPDALALAPDGSLFIAEAGAQRIRVVGPDGIIRTAVGGGSNNVWEEGAEATDLWLNEPFTAIPVGDRLFFRDNNHGFRELTRDGRTHKLTADLPRARGEGVPEPGRLRAGSVAVLPMPSMGAATGRLGQLFVASQTGLSIVHYEQTARYGSAEQGVDMELRREAEGWKLLALDGVEVARFDHAGLAEVERTSEGDVTYAWVDTDGNGTADEPGTVTTPSGTLSLEWTGGALSSLSGPGGTVSLSHTSGDLTRVAFPDGSEISYGYDSGHRLTSITDAAQGATLIGWDADGTAISETTPAMKTKAFQTRLAHIGFISSKLSSMDAPLPAAADEVFIRDEEGVERTFEVDALGRVVGMTDGTEATLRVERDADGRLLRRYLEDSDGLTLEGDQFLWNSNGLFKGWELGAGGGFGLYSWGDVLTTNGENVTPLADGDGRVTEVSNASGQKVQYGWKGNRITSIIDPGGGAWTFQYDVQGNLLTVLEPGGTTRSWIRDANGRATTYTDRAGRVHTYTRDGLGRLLSEDLSGRDVGFTYDAVGRLASVTSPEGQTATVEYDAMGNPTRSSHPATGTETLTWSPTGKLLSTTNGAGQTTIFSWSGNQLTGINAPEGSTSIVRDTFGLPTRIVGPQAGYEMTWSPNGVVQTVRTTNPAIQPQVLLSYEMDGFRQRSLQRPSGAMESFPVPSAGYTGFSVDDSVRNISVGGQYVSDTANRTQSMNLFVTDVDSLYFGAEFAFDSMGRMLTKKLSLASPTQLTEDYSYSYTPAGLVSQKSTPQGIESYSRDVFGRIVQVIRDGAAAESYTWGKQGNRLSANEVSYSYDPAGRLNSDGVYTYTWDGAGRLSTRTGRGEVWKYAWDSRDLLTGITADLDGDGSFEHVVEYAYDPYGRRVQKTVNGVVRRYVWDVWRVIEEYDGTDALVTERFYGIGRDELVALRSGGQMYTVVTDRLGTVEAAVKVDGAIAGRARYDAFGNKLSSSGSLPPEANVWAGHSWDPETGFYYMRARYYDPRTGRFISPDPSGVLGDYGLYTYAGGDPATLVDPLGLDPAPAEGVTAPNGGAKAIVEAGQEILDTNEGYWDHKLTPDKVGAETASRFHTHCNQFLQKLLEKCYADSSLNDKKINDIIKEHFEKGDGWDPVSDGARAKELADSGRMVVAAEASETGAGHVAVVVAEGAVPAGATRTTYDLTTGTAATPQAYSKSSAWPTLMQAGKTMGFLSVNYAWSRKDRGSVKYYVKKDACGCPGK